MATVTPISVFIPTFNRGGRVFCTLDRVLACDPGPCEIWVHVDKSDGKLEAELTAKFPSVRLLSSRERLGPGGGRHRCLKMCRSPYAVSFDDDSYPVDSDFFEKILSTFLEHPEAAIIGATIWQRNEQPIARAGSLTRKLDFIGCGYGVRLKAYEETRGYLSRPVPYGMEETDLSIQLFSKGWRIYQSGELRVFHDTDFTHRENPDITVGTISNVALFTFLHYPVTLWGWAAIQIGNLLRDCMARKRWKGMLKGLACVPADCYAHRRYRRPLPRRVVSDFLEMRRL
ncbi:MAG: family 2 glycosyl transferase [Acidobacteria bacterium]|nr:MAG: family 2 glycosyl transferase [Acidobacteriota bacterium]